MTLSQGGEIAIGLGLVVIAGALNGSWNASFSPTHGCAVGRNKDAQDLTYPLSWILFQIYAALINIPICLWWAGGPARVQFIVQESSSADLLLICFFAVLWGVGSVGFGLACKVAGVGLGTTQNVTVTSSCFNNLSVSCNLIPGSGGIQEVPILRKE